MFRNRTFAPAAKIISALSVNTVILGQQRREVGSSKKSKSPNQKKVSGSIKKDQTAQYPWIFNRWKPPVSKKVAVSTTKKPFQFAKGGRRRFRPTKPSPSKQSTKKTEAAGNKVTGRKGGPSQPIQRLAAGYEKKKQRVKSPKKKVQVDWRRKSLPKKSQTSASSAVRHHEQQKKQKKAKRHPTSTSLTDRPAPSVPANEREIPTPSLKNATADLLRAFRSKFYNQFSFPFRLKCAVAEEFSGTNILVPSGETKDSRFEEHRIILPAIAMRAEHHNTQFAETLLAAQGGGGARNRNRKTSSSGLSKGTIVPSPLDKKKKMVSITPKESSTLTWMYIPRGSHATSTSSGQTGSSAASSEEEKDTQEVNRPGGSGGEGPKRPPAVPTTRLSELSRLGSVMHRRVYCGENMDEVRKSAVKDFNQKAPDFTILDLEMGWLSQRGK